MRGPEKVPAEFRLSWPFCNFDVTGGGVTVFSLCHRDSDPPSIKIESQPEAWVLLFNFHCTSSMRK